MKVMISLSITLPTEGDRVAVEFGKDLWYLGKIVKTTPSTFKVDFDDGDQKTYKVGVAKFRKITARKSPKPFTASEVREMKAVPTPKVAAAPAKPARTPRTPVAAPAKPARTPRTPLAVAAPAKPARTPRTPVAAPSKPTAGSSVSFKHLGAKIKSALKSVIVKASFSNMSLNVNARARVAFENTFSVDMGNNPAADQKALEVLETLGFKQIVKAFADSKGMTKYQGIFRDAGGNTAWLSRTSTMAGSGFNVWVVPYEGQNQAPLDAIKANLKEPRAPRPPKDSLPPTTSTKAEAQFLAKWSKGKPIVSMGPDTTFHKSGKLMTQLTPETVASLEKEGYLKRINKTTFTVSATPTAPAAPAAAPAPASKYPQTKLKHPLGTEMLEGFKSGDLVKVTGGENTGKVGRVFDDDGDMLYVKGISKGMLGAEFTAWPEELKHLPE